MNEMQKGVTKMSNLFLIREEHGYFLCEGKPIPCKPYFVNRTDMPTHFYSFGGCNCIKIPDPKNIKMEIGGKPRRVNMKWRGESEEK